MFIRAFVPLTAFLIALAPQASLSACCDLVKIEADPPTTRVRVCDPNTTSGCTTWLFEGDVAAGAPRQICASGDSVTYQEWTAATNGYGPSTEARCEDGEDVEL